MGENYTKKTMKEGLTYKDAGVDIEAAEHLVASIKNLVKLTYRREVLSQIGHFGALFELDISRYNQPVLVSSTDGVGTKLKIAFAAQKHDTVGVDLVAMCVNDILTLGAEPLFFLDYLATGKLNPEQAEEILKGIVKGCKEAGCSLIGGETAEMPGMYREGEYDLCGFVVGVVEKEKIIDGSEVNEGDIVIGLASSGLHSNGYSLVRKVLFEVGGYTLDSYIEETGRPLAEELLQPTLIYVRPVMRLLRNGILPGAMAHITGGGLPLNVARVLPRGLSAVLKRDTWPVPPVFKLIKHTGKISDEEMFRTFNMGIGYVIILSESQVEEALGVIKEEGVRGYVIGRIVKGEGGVKI